MMKLAGLTLVTSLPAQGLHMTLDWYGSAMHCTARGSPRDATLKGVHPNAHPLGLVRLQNSRYAGFEEEAHNGSYMHFQIFRLFLN